MGKRRRTLPALPPGPVGKLGSRITGEVRLTGSVPYLEPDVEELREWLPLVRGSGEPPVREGDIVEAELVPAGDGAPGVALPFARIERVFGSRGTPAAEVGRIVASRGIVEEFPDAAIGEADALPSEVREQDRQGRKDLRRLPLVTIDGADAKDFDDAVAVERTEAGGFRLTVAIADVAHHVPVGSECDEEARRRGTSVYLPGRCIPMLPERISNDLCSLRPGVERLTMAATLDFDASGERLAARFSDAVIVSQARLTYTQVQAALDGDQSAAGPAWDHREHLQRMAELARRLSERRTEEGALDMDLPEPEVLLRDGGRTVEDVRARARQPAHRLIEEFMLAANRAVGAHFEAGSHPCIYRIHPPPPPDSVQVLARVAAAFGFELPGGRTGTPSPAALGRFLDEVAESSIGPALHYLALRALARAEYAVDDVGHYGLGASAYLHFTSPIRRYPDLVVHRLLKGLRSGRKKKKALVALQAELSEIAKACTDLERRAAAAEFEAIDLYRCLAVTDRLGEEFDAAVSTVTNFGLFVQLSAPFVEGLIHVSDLEDDWFDFDPNRLELVGRRTGRVYRLGQRLRVRIAQVDIGRRRISLVAVPEAAAA